MPKEKITKSQSKRHKAMKAKPAPVQLPDLIEVQVTEADIQWGGKTFSCNPIVHALAGIKLPVQTVGTDIAFIGGREYLATLDSADIMFSYLFANRVMTPFTYVAYITTDEDFQERMALRTKQSVLEKAREVRETLGEI